MNILYICSKNEWRSRTAETIFRNENNIKVRSAGTSKTARIRINQKLIEWSDVIFVMEDKHKKILKQDFRDLLNDKELIVLDIPDEYKYMDEELIEELKSSLNYYMEQN
ncbi:MAG: protein tyrosine phosphatase [Bacteroidota bacterium]